jgi:hypothetical protein
LDLTKTASTGCSGCDRQAANHPKGRPSADDQCGRNESERLKCLWVHEFEHATIRLGINMNVDKFEQILYLYIWVYVNNFEYLVICMQIFENICVYGFWWAFMNIFEFCIYKCIVCIYKHMNMHVWLYICIYIFYIYIYSFLLNICICVCKVKTRIYVYIHTRIYTDNAQRTHLDRHGASVWLLRNVPAEAYSVEQEEKSWLKSNKELSGDPHLW